MNDQGIVEQFDADVGLGVVVGDNGDRYGFHCTAIDDGSRTIEVGRAVTFVVGAAGPGVWEALVVTPVGAG